MPLTAWVLILVTLALVDLLALLWMTRKLDSSQIGARRVSIVCRLFSVGQGSQTRVRRLRPVADQTQSAAHALGLRNDSARDFSALPA